MPFSKDTSTIFIHIPKTAGTTLRSIIEDHFPAEQLYFLYIGNSRHPGMEEFSTLTDKEKRAFKIYCGHFHFGFHLHLPQPCRYVTMLRDPVERVISLYHHFLQEENALHDKSVEAVQRQIRQGNLSLAEFVASGITIDTDNYQARVLSGESPKFGECGRDLLEKAKNNLRKHFAVVGLTERFDESVMLLHKTLDWPVPFYVKKNLSTKRSTGADQAPETLEAIRVYNELDLELYQFAQDLLDEQIAKQGSTFHKEFEEFQIANRFYHLWIDKINSARGLQAKLDEMKNSWSWRVTAPLRGAVELLKKVR